MMNLCVIAVLVLGISAHLSGVSAVDCENDVECTKTMFTQAKCENKQCQCVDGYVASEEGCRKKLPKPEVKTSADHAAEAIESATVELTCAGSGTVYAWFKDETEVAGETQAKVSFTMGDANVDYQCQETSGSLKSEKSDKLTVKILKKEADAGASSAKPVVKLSSPDGVAKDKTFTAICTGYPYGLDPAKDIKLTDKDDNELPEQIPQPDTVTDQTITCKFDKDDYKFEESTTVNYPKVIDEVASASITSDKDIAADAAFKTTDTPTLTCNPTPGEDFLPRTVTYKWSEDSAPTNKEWKIPTAVETYDGITCTISDGTKPGVTSQPFPKITVGNDYLKEPKVTASPESPLATGQMTLTCETEEKDVQFTWTKDDTAIVDQMDKTIQYTNLDTTARRFTCSITKDMFSRASKEITLTASSTISKPIITGAVEIGQWGDMKLECASASQTPEMIYSWSKDGKVLKDETGKSYSKAEVEKSAAGEYTCTTSFKKLTAVTSDKIEVTVIPPGVTCAKDDDCDGNLKPLTGKCEKDRCVCASGFYARGSECGNGVSQVIGSLMMVLAAAFVSRLL